MSAERKDVISKDTKSLLIEKREGDEVNYSPILVNQTAKDDVTRFVIEETERLKGRLEDLRTIEPRISGGQRRSVRQTKDVRKNRERQIRKEKLEEKIAILDGAVLAPIRLVFEDEKIKTFEIARFTNEEQERWWKFVRAKHLMVELTKVAESYPEGVSLLAEVFSIRYRKKFGFPDEADQAAEDLNSFILKSRNIPREFDTILAPLFGIISESLS